MVNKLTYSGSDGDAATVNNTGWTQLVLTDANGSMLIEHDWKPRGRPSLLLTGTTSPGYVLGQLDFAATDALALEEPRKQGSLPASEQAVWWLGNASGSEVRHLSVVTDATGLVKIRDAAAANIYASAAGVLAVGVPVILSLYVTRSATAGTVRLVVYEEDGVTVRADSGLLTGRNTGSSGFTRVKGAMVKSSSSSTVASSARVGELRWDTAATGLLPPPAAFSPVRADYAGNGSWEPIDIVKWNGTGYESVVNEGG